MPTSTTDPVKLGSAAPAFCLPDTRNAQEVTLAQFAGQPLLVAFICNHCPYVVHILEPFVRLAHEFASLNVATVAISANDALKYPADSADNMGRLADESGFAFPYCYDETQQVARAYEAVCTPDLFLYDADHKLYYRGQFDATRPGPTPATGDDLSSAIKQLLQQMPPPSSQQPSVGCSIKWKPD